jgi:hypothetical protein
MTAKRRPAPKPATTTLKIIDICKAENLTEQAFRLALANLRPDDFDTIKELSPVEIEQVLATINPPKIAESLTHQGTQPIEADSTSEETSEIPKTDTQQGLQPVGLAVANSGNVVSGNRPKAEGLAALKELVAAAEEEIELADLVSQFKNQQIIQNAEARDNELAVRLRDRRLYLREDYLNSIRSMQSTRIESPELPSDDFDLNTEVESLNGELGKQLTVSA